MMKEWHIILSDKACDAYKYEVMLQSLLYKVKTEALVKSLVRRSRERGLLNQQSCLKTKSSMKKRQKRKEVGKQQSS